MHDWTHQQPCWRRTVQTGEDSISRKPEVEVVVSGVGGSSAGGYTVNLILTEE